MLHTFRNTLVILSGMMPHSWLCFRGDWRTTLKKNWCDIKKISTILRNLWQQWLKSMTNDMSYNKTSDSVNNSVRELNSRLKTIIINVKAHFLTTSQNPIIDQCQWNWMLHNAKEITSETNKERKIRSAIHMIRQTIL